MQHHYFQQQVVRSLNPRRSSAGCSRSFAADPCSETADPNMTQGYAIGETEFECWSSLWKARPSDPELDAEEWVIFLERIQERFRNNYENSPDEFFFWGDFSGDRTLDMKIAKPTVLTACLLSDLQKYLQINGQKMWRIRIPIYFKPDDPHRVIVVYPYAIDIPLIREAAVIEDSTTCESVVLAKLRTPNGDSKALTHLTGNAEIEAAGSEIRPYRSPHEELKLDAPINRRYS